VDGRDKHGHDDQNESRQAFSATWSVKPGSRAVGPTMTLALTPFPAHD
jgi:hypothetical protein